MDQASVTAILHHLGNDAIVHPTGDGVLVDLPMRYGNGDGVRLLVEPAGDEYRVTDRGEAADRLLVAGLNLKSKRRVDVLAEVIRTAQVDAVSIDQGELSVFGPADELGRMLADVACASLQVEELRWQPHREPTSCTPCSAPAFPTSTNREKTSPTLLDKPHRDTPCPDSSCVRICKNL